MVRIKSITDVVTNSSSEVFILQKDDAHSLERDYPFVNIYEITLDSIKGNSWYSDLYSWAAKTIDESIPYVDENIDTNEWKELVEKHKKAFETLANEYMEVDIEDHYEEWEDATDEARSDSISSKNCH